MSDEKYVVVKRSDAERIKVNVPGGSLLDTIEYSELAIKDAVVIRTQDVFAASGLSAYAQNIDAFCAIARLDIKRRGLTARHQDQGLYDMIDRLDMIADYFHSVAQEAEARMEDGECKVPD